jgi:hypothetical protein
MNAKSAYLKTIFSCGVLVVFLGAVIALAQVVRSASERVAHGQQELARRTYALGSFSALKSDYERAAKGYFPLLYRKVPTREQYIFLGNDFKLFARQHNLDLTFLFGEETPPAGDGFGIKRFTLTAKGKVDDITAFVASIDTFQYATEVEGFSMTQSEQEKGELTLRGKVFFRSA